MICDVRHFERIVHKVHHSVMHVGIYDTRGRDHCPYHSPSFEYRRYQSSFRIVLVQDHKDISKTKICIMNVDLSTPALVTSMKRSTLFWSCVCVVAGTAAL